MKNPLHLFPTPQLQKQQFKVFRKKTTTTTTTKPPPPPKTENNQQQQSVRPVKDK